MTVTDQEGKDTAIDFNEIVLRELRELKKITEKHTHNIEQLRRAVVTINEWLKKDAEETEIQKDIDKLKAQKEEIINEELKIIKERIKTIETKTIPLPFQFERNLSEEIDELKLRLNEVQAKQHRKFAGGGEDNDLVIYNPPPKKGE